LDALELSRATFNKIRQNLWWAFAYNLVGIPLAAGVFLPSTGLMLTPSISGALMGVSSLGVMANSLLLQLEHKVPGRKSAAKLEEHKVPGRKSTAKLEELKEAKSESGTGVGKEGDIETGGLRPT
jgi:Cu+-exporting ATPase